MYSVKTGSLANGGLKMIEFILFGISIYFMYSLYKDFKKPKNPPVTIKKNNNRYKVKLSIEIEDLTDNQVSCVVKDYQAMTEEYFDVKTK